MDTASLNRRLILGGKHSIAERFAKSPNLTQTFRITSDLQLSYAPQDRFVLSLVEEACRKAYAYVKNWFDYGEDMALDLWMAPEVVDLHYMVCQPCDAKWFCAPGSRDGRGIILFVSPLACAANAWPDRLSGCLGHEITHHLLENITRSGICTMKRKEEQGLPMWLEEGLCQVVQAELHPACRSNWRDKVAERSDWYDLDELWNDLSACDDVQKAYLQAYGQTRVLLDAHGKAEIIRLLKHFRSHAVDWNGLAKETEGGRGDFAGQVARPFFCPPT